MAVVLGGDARAAPRRVREAGVEAEAEAGGRGTKKELVGLHGQSMPQDRRHRRQRHFAPRSLPIFSFFKLSTMPFNGRVATL
ncbi:hypothetical protein [Burkholderia sp. BDU5]|uniref:hypothetical protein n=1 Tax=Burkholderia sp. BDU5 TaxID=1385590 RepID=UPI0012E33E30|nr:hypothetical protein [Burkholderia sp. BDU5]